MAPSTSGRPFPRRARGTQSPGMAHSERYNTLNNQQQQQIAEVGHHAVDLEQVFKALFQGFPGDQLVEL